ncbi:GPI-anchored cell wall beta-1,3-endoglucanase EglC [Penicillium digitatum]|uniref:Probable glucan endo-1,3-beta-glucosidase eglC n=3 Tax=Penicillium digitatum TaxID=36651 RepID=K9GD53_PEND2|nr:GPI-anchored cell wall beta-1,3-endoglucanase EglC [Penicillium digitatum Pd1]EKV19122.1 GPI-anchored cell wall beta-1,3-endoglucanase EglC [Penicillium digitatum PHI26]EKV21031.1 GPI-anchored cell wall beta-1,3-endoglucanase EglC [Penicillium digitatum Pd1]QQK48355.1 GPI-anchored cell wall beta-1,3-endoglucanase EglC [Penicillium digitatum]
MRPTQLLALAMAIATSEAVSQGFNYGATKVDGSVKVQADFETEFSTAKNLVGTDNAFTSARLYTMIQGGTTNGPIEAIPAAIKEKTTLLLGLWASGGDMANEIAALKTAISTYGNAFTDLVVGISVGSEDLYRNSVTGVKANAGLGAQPTELVDYIHQVRSAISGTSLSGAPIGHVDTWNSWTNGSNSAVVEAVDWLGFDGYPYYENTDPNSVEDAKALFNRGVERTKAIAGGKEVWITETGWPTTGSTQNLAVASVANAKKYWDEVACPLLGVTNTWWYILDDAGTTAPSFGVTGSATDTTPLYDLSCKASTSSSSAVASSSTSGAGTAEKSGVLSGASASATGSSGSSSSGSSGSGSSGSGSSDSGSSGSGSSGSGSSGSSPVGASSASVTPGVRPSTKPMSKGASGSAYASGFASRTATGFSSSATGGSKGSGSGSGSSSSDSASASSSVSVSSATRVAGSAAGALVAALALAFTF